MGKIVVNARRLFLFCILQQFFFFLVLFVKPARINTINRILYNNSFLVRLLNINIVGDVVWCCWCWLCCWWAFEIAALCTLQNKVPEAYVCPSGFVANYFYICVIFSAVVSHDPLTFSIWTGCWLCNGYKVYTYSLCFWYNCAMAVQRVQSPRALKMQLTDMCNESMGFSHFSQAHRCHYTLGTILYLINVIKYFIADFHYTLLLKPVVVFHYIVAEAWSFLTQNLLVLMSWPNKFI